jgi:hypothetical protein
MRSSLVVIFLVGIEQMAQMPFAEHDNMVKTIPSDRTDESLRISVLPWRPRRNRSIPDTHCSKPLDDDIAIDDLIGPEQNRLALLRPNAQFRASAVPG